LCGGVTYETRTPLQPILQCHCQNCRRLTGNFVAGARVDNEGLEIRDAHETFAWYDLGYASYGFCRGCGSTLFYRANDRPEVTAVMVGTLDDASGLSLRGVWFADEAQPHNQLPEGVPHYEGNG
jgi:hypothetical protein